MLRLFTCPFKFKSFKSDFRSDADLPLLGMWVLSFKPQKQSVLSQAMMEQLQECSGLRYMVDLYLVYYSSSYKS